MGHPHHIFVELALGIAAHVNRRLFGGRHIGDQGLDVLNPVEGKTYDAAGEVGVAAAEILWRFLHHQHRAADLLGGHGGAQGRIARADYYNVIGSHVKSSITVGQGKPPDVLLSAGGFVCRVYPRVGMNNNR